MDQHEHNWEPAAVLDEPGRLCMECRAFEQISKREFKDYFKMSFWRMKKAYDDANTHGGYKGRARG